MHDLCRDKLNYSKTILSLEDGNKYSSGLYGRNDVQCQRYCRYDIVVTSLQTTLGWSPNKFKERTRRITVKSRLTRRVSLTRDKFNTHAKFLCESNVKCFFTSDITHRCKTMVQLYLSELLLPMKNVYMYTYMN